MTSDLTNLQKRIQEFVDARDWGQFHNPKDLAITLSLEASELLEHFQWKTPEEITKHLETHKSDVEDEISDVLWNLLLICNKLDVNPIEAFNNKFKKIERKYPIEKARGNHKKYTEHIE